MNNPSRQTSTQIARRLREVFIDGRFIANTNYKEQLAGVSWKQANMQIGNLNTIVALTFHINYYLEGLLHVFNGGALEIRDKYSFDHPAVASEQDWNTMVNTLLNNAEKFADKVEQFTNDELELTFVDEKYGTCLRNIEAVIEHSYYHLGQVVLIRKMIAESYE
jgi:hypothetical protein